MNPKRRSSVEITTPMRPYDDIRRYTFATPNATVSVLVSATPEPTFDLPSPFLLDRIVLPHEIDEYQHVNNTHYVRWLDEAAWGHSAALGLPVDTCVGLNRGMAVVRTVIVYLRPGLLGESLQVATWLLPGVSRVRVRRRFQVVRPADGQTLARAEVEYACIELSTGRPARWPREFHDSYAVLPEVSAAVERLAPL